MNDKKPVSPPASPVAPAPPEGFLQSATLELDAARAFVVEHLYFAHNQEQIAVKLAVWHKKLNDALAPVATGETGQAMFEALKAWEHWYSVDSTEYNRDAARKMGLRAMKKYPDARPENQDEFKEKWEKLNAPQAICDCEEVMRGTAGNLNEHCPVHGTAAQPVGTPEQVRQDSPSTFSHDYEVGLQDGQRYLKGLLWQLASRKRREYAPLATLGEANQILNGHINALCDDLEALAAAPQGQQTGEGNDGR